MIVKHFIENKEKSKNQEHTSPDGKSPTPEHRCWGIPETAAFGVLLGKCSQQIFLPPGEIPKSHFVGYDKICFKQKWLCAKGIVWFWQQTDPECCLGDSPVSMFRCWWFPIWWFTHTKKESPECEYNATGDTLAKVAATTTSEDDYSLAQWIYHQVGHLGVQAMHSVF